MTVPGCPCDARRSPADDSLCASTENVYESVNTSATRKKAKADGVKKRKGPPKSKTTFTHFKVITRLSIMNEGQLTAAAF